MSLSIDGQHRFDVLWDARMKEYRERRALLDPFTKKEQRGKLIPLSPYAGRIGKLRRAVGWFLLACSLVMFARLAIARAETTPTATPTPVALGRWNVDNDSSVDNLFGMCQHDYPGTNYIIIEWYSAKGGDASMECYEAPQPQESDNAKR